MPWLLVRCCPTPEIHWHAGLRRKESDLDAVASGKAEMCKTGFHACELRQRLTVRLALVRYRESADFKVCGMAA